MAQYALVADYELRTGVDVPVEMEPTIQARLDDTSALIELYLGDCAADVEAAFPEILTALTVGATYRTTSTPPGVKSESIGSTSVTYAEAAGDGTALSIGVTDILDDLMDRACTTSGNGGVPGLGTVGATWGGRGPVSETAWMRDVDLWVV